MTKVYRFEIFSFVRKFFIAFHTILTSYLQQSTETKSDIFSVDVAQMKFNRIFFKSDDFITAFDVNRNSICCANYSGRIFVYDFVKRTQVVENQLKLQKRTSSTSDTDTFETPHVSTIAFSLDGCHLLCGFENGSLVVLDPDVLHEVKTMFVSNGRIVAIKFSPDSCFVTLYVRKIAEVFRFQLFLFVRRMKTLRWFWCTTKNRQWLMEVGRFWVGFVSMPKPFAIFYIFLAKFLYIWKLLQDWFLWPMTGWVCELCPTRPERLSCVFFSKLLSTMSWNR